MLNLYRILRAAALLVALPFAALAQGVGIGTTAPDASAALDIVSSSKGLLLPRVADATGIASPAPGLLVYQTGGTAGFYYNAGTAVAPAWQQLATAADAAVTATNGLTKTGSAIGLGGTLTAPTTLSQAGFDFGLTGGRVGIGTATPTARLTVTGAEATPNGLGAAVQLTNTNSPNNWYLRAGATGTNTPANGFSIADDGAYRLTITSTGNVGIGQPTPTFKLDVAGNLRVANTSGEFYVNNFPASTISSTVLLGTFNGANGNGPQLRFTGAGTGGGFMDIGQNTAGDFVVQGNDVDRLTVLNTGNVGIGTTTPLTRLSLSPGTNEPKITLYDGGSTTTHYGFGTSNGQLNYDVDVLGASYVFYAGGKNGTGTELMRIKGNGRVGIGTSAPAYPLDVAGDLNISTMLRTAGTPMVYARGANVFLGTKAYNATAPTGSANTAVGDQAGLALTSGLNNTMVGALAGDALTSGGSNVFVGIQAGGSTTTGSDNVFIGHDPGLANVSGSGNVGLGANALNVATADGNTAVGTAAGINVTTGAYNTFVGSGASLSSATQRSHATAIGANAKVDQDDAVVLGDATSAALRVGIGTTAPTSTLAVSGSVSVAYTTASADLALTAAHYTVRRFGGCNTLTLPQPGTCVGRLYVLINSNATNSNVALAVASSGGIYDDVLNQSITTLAPNNRLTVQSDGANWIVLGR